MPNALAVSQDGSHVFILDSAGFVSVLTPDPIGRVLPNGMPNPDGGFLEQQSFHAPDGTLAIALDPSARVYTSNVSLNQRPAVAGSVIVHVFEQDANGQYTEKRSFTDTEAVDNCPNNASNCPLAVDPALQVYVAGGVAAGSATPGFLSAFPVAAAGATAPFATISGSLTQLFTPAAIAIVPPAH
jgi:hypothetical protein